MWGYKRICNPCLSPFRAGLFCFCFIYTVLQNGVCEHDSIQGWTLHIAIYEVISEEWAVWSISELIQFPITVLYAVSMCLHCQRPSLCFSNQQCEEQSRQHLEHWAVQEQICLLAMLLHTTQGWCSCSWTTGVFKTSRGRYPAGLNIISSARDSAQLGYDISLKEFNTVYAETQSLSPLVQLVDTYGAGQLLEVQTLSYNVTVTTQTQ